MIKGSTISKAYSKAVKDVELISVSQDKRSFYKELIDNITETTESGTVLIHLLNENSSQATLIAECNIFFDDLKRFLTIDSTEHTIWSPIRENRIKVFRNLVSNEKVGEKIKSLGKSAALGVPIANEKSESIGCIWVLDNNNSVTTPQYIELRELLLETAKKIAWKEENDKNTEGLH
ncbi:MAG: hypothetical protein GWO07_13015 [Candidatus Dadabacteria bacterium]|nr:hypothetical protein [Candidatus Dadabacteria bacterium]NIS09650.1 hypothetical protein [Candidatus Dadabacteria bacterium]NIV41128.1 hypothetical protein [Candidatus Dadabacteria bacterium]NIX16121.1 hypothetical protein [Candidatus Dadabacteria bacterium]NIY21671.1 hypothetical protein [Candidatus Dadabacteria bacterium]